MSGQQQYVILWGTASRNVGLCGAQKSDMHFLMLMFFNANIDRTLFLT